MCKKLMLRTILFTIISTFFFFTSSALDKDDKKRINQLYSEIKCVVCTAQSIKFVDNPIAQDIKQVIVRMVEEGKSDAQIKDYLRSKYGEEITFEPKFSMQNAFLWLVPLLSAVLLFYLLFL